MLEVVKFVPKPLLEIHAVKFTGGSEQAAELIRWVGLLGGTAEWHEEDPGSHVRCGLKEHIRVLLGSAYMFVYVGDYIMQDEEGSFKGLSNRLAELKYDRVIEAAQMAPLRPVSDFDEAVAA